MQLKEIIPSIIDLFPENEWVFEKKLREKGSSDLLLTDISLQIKKLLEVNWFEIDSDDFDIWELRHVLRHTALRIEKNTQNPKLVYFWMDVTRSSLRRLFLDFNPNSVKL